MDYGFGTNTEMEELLGAIVGIFLVFCMVMLLVLIVKLAAYILKGMGLYQMAQRQGLDYPWLGYVPYARTYLQGEISGDVMIGKKSVRNPGIWLIVVPFVWAFVSGGVNGITGGILGAMLAQSETGNGSVAGILTIFCVIMVFWIVICMAYAAGYRVLRGLIDYQIFIRVTSKNMAFVHALLSVLLPLYESILFFVMRNKEYNPGMEPPVPAKPEPVSTGEHVNQMIPREVPIVQNEHFVQSEPQIPCEQTVPDEPLEPADHTVTDGERKRMVPELDLTAEIEAEPAGEYQYHEPQGEVTKLSENTVSVKADSQEEQSIDDYLNKEN